MTQNQYFLLSASGDDRPGIVRDVTAVLFQIGANLEDSSMMRLGSEFAMFAIFSLPKSRARGLRARVHQLAKRSQLTTSVKRLTAAEAASQPTRRSAWIVSLRGPDKPGLVHRLTSALARRQFNITDLYTHRTASPGHAAGFMMFIEGEFPNNRAPHAFRRQLIQLGRRLRTHISLRPVVAAPL